jgi:hypothetical protein
MKRELALQHLAQAEQAVADGCRHIAGQRAVIQKLDEHGQETVEAERLLQTYLELQRMHEDHRDRLKQELGGAV